MEKSPIGNLVYLGLNYQITGNAFQFTVYQKNHWYHTTTWFTNCVAEIMRYISGQVSDTTLLIWYPELILFVERGDKKTAFFRNTICM